MLLKETVLPDSEHTLVDDGSMLSATDAPDVDAADTE